ncbi:MAG: Glutathione-binding protein GsiB [Firmicutes bacterium]|nr:Glutathione-binding protein GsiB [candidate division NPL-UPA2 bacterium]
MKLVFAVTAGVVLLVAPLIWLWVLQPAPPEIIVALEAEPITLDPFNAVDHISPVVQQVIFEGLLELGANNTVLPKLATAFTVSDDGRAITLTLRQGVRFHDGTPFDAAAVKQNFEFLLDPRNQMARRYLFDFIDAITVHDPHSITFASNRADYALSYYFAHPAAGIKSARELDKRARDPLHNLTHTAVGTGPFRLILWHGRRYVELEPNPYYWDSSAKPASRLRFLFVPDAKQRMEMLKRGDAHVAFPATPAEPLQSKDLTALEMPLPQVYYVGLNLAHRELMDVRVRKAMNYAVNREHLMAAANMRGLPLATPVSPAIFGYAPTEDFTYNPSRARSLLAQANWAQLSPLELFVADRPETVALARAVEADLAAIGIIVEVVTLPEGALLARLDAGDAPDMWLMHWRPYSGEIHAVLAANFTQPRAFLRNNNAGAYFNEQIERRLDKARATPQLSAALEEFAELQATVREDAPWLFLFTPARQAVHMHTVTGIEVGANGALRLSRIRLARHVLN